MFYNLLKNSNAISVYGNGHTETTFYYKNNGVYYDNDELGYNCLHEDFTLNPLNFERHINNMLSEKFIIEINNILK